MKYFALLGLLSAFVLFPVAANADWTENFDSYALGSSMAGQGGWQGWDGNAGATAYVTNAQSHSSPHSVDINGPSDLVHTYTGYTTGQWVYTAWQYIPTGFTGTTYFILLSTYNDFGPYAWTTQVEFASTGIVMDDASGATLPLITGRWVEIRVEIDLATDMQSFFYDNQLLYSAGWTSNFGYGGPVEIAAVDLYANSASSVYYDDMSLLPAGGVPAEESTWGGVKNLFR